MAMQVQSFKRTTSIASLNDDLLLEVLLRLPSPASLARAALASKHLLGLASAPAFLRRFRARHASSPLLGLFVSHGCPSGLPPVFHPAAAARSDPDLGAAVRGGDFSLTRIGGDPDWRLEDCRNGRLLLSSGAGASLAVFDPVARRCVPIRRPSCDPFPDTYIADCLLHGAAAASFRVVSVQHHGRRIRTAEYSSGAREWRFHPWVENIKRPQRSHQTYQAMQATGLIFWKFEDHSSLVLDTSTMEFSILRLPVAFFQPSKYAIGEIEDGACCLVCVDGSTMDDLYLQVWLLVEDIGGKNWEFHKEMPVGEVLGRHARVRQVLAVANGLALVCWNEHGPQFCVDLKSMSLKAEFICRGLACLFQMPWPPTLLASTGEIGSSESNRHGGSHRSLETEDSDGPFEPPYVLPHMTYLTQLQKKIVKKKVRGIQSEVPVYVAIMNKYNVAATANRNYGVLEFGSRYAAGHLPGNSQIMVLEYMGRIWQTNMNVCRKQSRWLLHKGWSKFVRANRLRVGDICLFELKKKEEEITMAVHIIFQ